MAQQPRPAAFGAALRKARIAAGLIQAEFASAAALDRGAVALLESGRGRLSSLDKVLERLGLEIRSRHLPVGPVGPALRGLRIRRKLSRRTMARHLDVSRNTLACLEAGGPGRVEMLVRYAESLGATLSLVPTGQASSFHVVTAASSVHHGWETPAQLAEQLNTALGTFDLDPCAGSRDPKRAAVRARVRLTAEDDGLHAPWRGLVFVNPPYGRSTRHWVEKCAEEAEKPDTTVVALLAVRTDTRWWRELVADKASICFLKGRLKFGDGRKDAPFASAIVVWNGSEPMIAKLKSALTGSWQHAANQRL